MGKEDGGVHCFETAGMRSGLSATSDPCPTGGRGLQSSGAWQAGDQDHPPQDALGQEELGATGGNLLFSVVFNFS